MADLEPYFKFLYLVAIIGVLYVNKIFLTDPDLRQWILQSFEDDNGRASGKALSAFACTFAIVTGWFIAMHYGDHHLAPEYYFIGLLSYAGGLYGIKELGRVMNTKYTAPYNGKPNTGEVCDEPSDMNAEDLLSALKTKYTESKSTMSFEEWLKALDAPEVNTEPEN